MAGSKTKKRKKSRKLDLQRVGDIAHATKDRALSGAEHRELLLAVELLTELVNPDRNNERMDAVFEDSSTEEKEDGHSDADDERKPRAGGNGRKRPDQYPGANHIDKPHPELKHGQLCPCGCGGRIYRTQRVKIFRHIVGRPSIEITFYHLEELKCNHCDAVYSAPAPEGVGPNSFDATAITMFALSRYATGVPMYRAAAFLGYLGVAIAASTQYEQVAKAAELLVPVHHELERVAAQGKLAYLDDTSMTILQFEREPADKRTGIHTTAILSVHDAFEIALFYTGREHAGENINKLDNLRSPDLPAMMKMSDGLAANTSVYHSLEDVIANCMGHGRRNFVKVAEQFPEQTRHVLLAIGSVYSNDAKTEGMDPQARLEYHQTNSKPVLEELHDHLSRQLADKLVEPNSPLGKAMKYMIDRWAYLTLFLRVPGAPLDNSAAERLIKKAVMHRKNSMFYLTAKGAKTGDLFMSLIFTCKLNKINPFDYLTELQRNADRLQKEPGEWLPWNYQATLQRLKASQPPS